MYYNSSDRNKKWTFLVLMTCYDSMSKSKLFQNSLLLKLRKYSTRLATLRKQSSRLLKSSSRPLINFQQNKLRCHSTEARIARLFCICLVPSVNYTENQTRNFVESNMYILSRMASLKRLKPSVTPSNRITAFKCSSSVQISRVSCSG